MFTGNASKREVFKYRGVATYSIHGTIIRENAKNPVWLARAENAVNTAAIGVLYDRLDRHIPNTIRLFQQSEQCSFSVFDHFPSFQFEVRLRTTVDLFQVPFIDAACQWIERNGDKVSDITVRLGRPDDFEAAIGIYLASNDARRGGIPTPVHHIERVRASMRKPDAINLIAEDERECVGMALAMQGLANYGAGAPEPGICFISMIFVSPERWGEGIGGKLVEGVLAEAQSQGYDRLQLWTHADNIRAQRLYERRGFFRNGNERENDLGEPVVMYERNIGFPEP
ncbi:MAG: GNAT family N-acetyltransferase [Thermomicrobiales bacterium]